MHHLPLRITRRRLPHWERDGSIYFITFNTWEKLQLSPTAQQIVFDSCLFFHLRRYKLSAFVVMPDPVHLLIQPLIKANLDYWRLSEILHSLKSYTAKQIPKAMPHIGTLWQSERYDRIVRNVAEFERMYEYIRQNPVKAGLSQTPEDYRFLWP
ncbi:MAG: transposase [Cyanobacteria bacterium J06554_6]